MISSPRIMVLDGEYIHTVAVQRELKSRLGAFILSVASSTRAAAHHSRHTDIPLLAPSPDKIAFKDKLLRLVEVHRPDAVLPIGFESHKSVLSIASQFPEGVKLIAPGLESFKIASSKTRTYELAQSIGLRVPKKIPFDNSDLPAFASSIEYPIFAKARLERGGESTALINNHQEFIKFDAATLGGDVIFQEYISGSPYTYAQCGYFHNGEPVIAFQHVELRSVPRRGGSGTRVKAILDPDVANAGNQLMKELRWDGYAQVEFKKTEAGETVLMEINPKLWASYALASQSGHSIVSTVVAHALGLEDSLPAPEPRLGTSVTFPLREIRHMRSHWRSENMLSSAIAMLWPPAQSDIEMRDIRAYIPRRL